MFIIKTKNIDFTGKLVGIKFIKGVGEVENLSPSNILWFENLGAVVEEVKKNGKNKKDTGNVGD